MFAQIYMSSFHVGDVMEVQWDLNETGSSSEWWRALVSEAKTHRVQGKGVTVLQLTYDERIGYPVTRQDVLVFRRGGKDMLQCLITSTEMEWRPVRQFTVPESRATPNEFRRIALHSTDEELRFRVTRLERLTGLSIEGMNQRSRSMETSGWQELRPLLYLRDHIAHLLSKPLLQFGTGTRPRESFGRQDKIVAKADCSLAEFWRIWEKIRSDTSTRANLYPPVNYGGTPAETIARKIQFQSFSDVCSALGYVSMDTKLQWLLKIRRKRGSHRPSAIRMLGVVVSSEEESMLPFCITIGTNPVALEGEVGSKKVPVLYRKD